MRPEFAIKLVAIFEAYFSIEEAREIASMFDVTLTSLDDFEPRWLAIARELGEKLDHGNARRFVDSVIDLASARNDEGLGRSTYERLTFHQSMGPAIARVQELLAASASPSEIAVAAGNAFAAKSLVRELLESATTEILIVDPYIGVATLDCLRTVSQPMRLLTSLYPPAIESGFDAALAAFNDEGRELAVRRAQHLHDRHLVFNERCWLVGGSLKDAGKKAFNCIEISDQRSLVVADLETKWRAAIPYR
jgi:hypothetical protein